MILESVKLVHIVKISGKPYMTVRLFHDKYEPSKGLNVTSRWLKELDCYDELLKSGKIVVYDIDRAKAEKNKPIIGLIRHINNYQPLMFILQEFGQELNDLLLNRQECEVVEPEVVEKSNEQGDEGFSRLSTLVKIEQDGWVRAESVWESLEINTPYRKWFPRRVNDLDLKNPNDYREDIFVHHNNGTSKTIHMVRIDIAKEMAMLERNKRGKLLRKYFIEAEKKLRQVAHLSQLKPAPEAESIEARLTHAATAAKKLKEIYDITGVKGAGASDAIYKFLNQEYQINLFTPEIETQQEVPTQKELPPAHSQWVTPTKLGAYLGKIAEKSISGKEMNQLLCQGELQRASGPRGGAPFSPTDKAQGLYAKTQTQISNHNGTTLKPSLVWDLEKTAEIMIDYVQ